MLNSRKLRVFVCYSSQDKPFIHEIYQRLSSEDWVDVWLDEKKLLPGQSWGLEIEQAVDAADAVIVCLSNNSVTKEGFVQKELRIILDKADEKPEGTIYVIPLRLDNCSIPRRLNNQQYVDYFPFENKTKAYQSLLRSLTIRAKDIGAKVFSSDPFKSFISSRLSPSGHPIYLIGGVEFVKVPKGEFLMGSKDSDLDSHVSEKPQHIINIPYDYLISRFPITNQQFALIDEYVDLGLWGKTGWERLLNHPAVLMSWESAVKFCDCFTKKYPTDLPTDYLFRLPTEAEWEKAARGNDSRIYPWGNEPPERHRANYSDNILMSYVKLFGNALKDGETTPVDKYSPLGDSPYGVSDMVGNVMEYTQSLYRRYPYDSKDGREVLTTSGSHVRRGGGFMETRENNRISARLVDVRKERDYRDAFTGFRVVLSSAVP